MKSQLACATSVRLVSLSVCLSAIVQWNLRIKHTFGQGVLSFRERFPLFVG